MKNLFLRSLTYRFDGLASLVLRLSFGILMIPHSFFKINNFDKIVGEFINFLGMGSHATLWIVIIIELFCSLMLIIGLLTRLAVIPLLITAIIIVFVAHHGDILGEGSAGFFYFIGYSAIALLGPGKYSLDRLLSQRLSAHERL
jgi:putative oxidoreductase